MTPAFGNAKAFARRGVPVFPIFEPLKGADGQNRCACGDPKCKSPAKHPRIQRGLKSAVTDEKQIKDWWAKWPDANLGIVTGPASGLFVLDVDPDHDGDETLAKLESDHGELPATWRVITGSGGEHVFFKYPRVEGREFRNSAGRLGQGLDTRGAGGYVVGPGSRHIRGRTYEWSVDGHPTEVELADTPQWLIDLLEPKVNNGTALPADWVKLVLGGVSEGGRNTAIARLAGHLLRRNVDAVVTLGLVHSWNETRCKPPLDADEVERTVNSVAGSEMKRRGLA